MNVRSVFVCGVVTVGALVVTACGASAPEEQGEEAVGRRADGLQACAPFCYSNFDNMCVPGQGRAWDTSDPFEARAQALGCAYPGTLNDTGNGTFDFSSNCPYGTAQQQAAIQQLANDYAYVDPYYSFLNRGGNDTAAGCTTRPPPFGKIYLRFDPNCSHCMLPR